MFRILSITALLAIACGCQSATCGRGTCGQSACGQAECGQTECGKSGGACGGKSWCGMPICCPPHHEEHYCRYYDETKAKCRAYFAAHGALHDMASECGMSCDFRRGFEQAFKDVALGSDGRVPALPPAPYWKDCARSPAGHARAQEWFAGYETGAEIAFARRGVSNYVYSPGAPNCQRDSACGTRWAGAQSELQ